MKNSKIANRKITIIHVSFTTIFEQNQNFQTQKSSKNTRFQICFITFFKNYKIFKNSKFVKSRSKFDGFIVIFVNKQNPLKNRRKNCFLKNDPYEIKKCFLNFGMTIFDDSIFHCYQINFNFFLK